MAYETQNFKKGMTLEHYHLENIEKGILDNIEAIKNINITGNNIFNSFNGKVVSILGDSISTFAGYIPEADGHNLAHRPRYPQSDPYLLMDVELTWWHRLITNLGAKLGVNDSWAGSTVSNTRDSNTGDYGPDAAMASITRISNLGSNGTPDLIFFYGGTNDTAMNASPGAFDSTANHNAVDLTTKKWSNFADAYKTAIMRLQYYYPDAKIISLLPMWTTQHYTIARMEAYGEVVKDICDYFGVPVIDLRACGVNYQNKGYTLGDGIHPNALGMELMEKYIRRQLFSFYEGDYTEHVVYSVTNNLTTFVNNDRYIKGVSAGESYTATLSGTINNLSVKMNGVDITSDVFNVTTSTISIPSVTGNIVIDESGASLGTYHTITYQYVNSNGETIQNSTTEYVLEDSIKNISTINAPYIDGYIIDSVTPSGEQTITEDITIIYTYKISNTTWYLDHRNNASKFSTSANSAGRGWTHVEGTAAYNAYVGKPVNTMTFFTNKDTQTVVVTKISSKNASEGEVISTVTATKNENDLAIITFPEVTIQEGEYLSLFSDSNEDIHFYYANSAVTDANGTVDGNFYGRVPKVYGSGNAWNAVGTAYTLGWSVGYTVSE